jgi:hypothetical protein
LAAASLPWLYSDCKVTAAAMPDGKRSFSWLIMLRFIGMARATPRARERKSSLPAPARAGGVPSDFGGHAEHEQRGRGRHHGAARRVAGRRRRRLHAVAFQNGKRRARQADAQAQVPQRKGNDARGDGHAQAPAGLEPDIEIGEGEQKAEERAQHHRAQGELRRVLAAEGAPVPGFLVEGGDLGGLDVERPAGCDFLGGARRLLKQGHGARLLDSTGC